MHKSIRTNLDNLWSADRQLQNKAFAVKDEKIKAKALELIETAEDIKYRKKYASLWRGI